MPKIFVVHSFIVFATMKIHHTKLLANLVFVNIISRHMHENATTLCLHNYPDIYGSEVCKDIWSNPYMGEIVCCE